MTFDVAKLTGSDNLLLGVIDLAGMTLHANNLEQRPLDRWGRQSIGAVSSIATTPGNPSYAIKLGKAGYPANVAYEEFSLDKGENWQPLASAPPRAPTGDDGALGEIAASATVHAEPETGAMVPDVLVRKTVGQNAPASPNPFYSNDNGKTWHEAEGVAPAPGPVITSLFGPGKALAADAVDGKRFYLYDWQTGLLWLSRDGAARWSSVPTPLPQGVFAEVRAIPQRAGHLLIACGNMARPGEGGLYHVDASAEGEPTFSRAPDVTLAAAVAFGAPAPGRSNAAAYVVGVVGGELGVFSSDDVTEGSTSAHFRLLAGKAQVVENSGQPLPLSAVRAGTLEADPDQYGKFYVAPLGRGLFFGEATR